MILQSLEAIQDVVRTAAEAGTSLNVIGAGTWTTSLGGLPPGRALSLAAYIGVVDYVPGDLTITVRAGTTLRQINEITRSENQWLPLDPFGSSDGTIGATIATCSYGPLATAFGTPRDLLLGAEAVLGNGDLIRAGGRVVKNVAGYDICRLLTGSWGTLGAITEVTLRLFAKQEGEASIALALPAAREDAIKLISGIRRAPLYPWAMDLFDANFSALPGIAERDDDRAFLAFRFGGNENAVQAQIQSIQSLGNTQTLEPEFWTKVRTIPHAWSVRISSLPSRILATWDAAGQFAAAAGGTRIATPEKGMVRVFFPPDVDQARLKLEVQNFVSDASRSALRLVVESLPSLAPLTLFTPDPAVTNQISQGIKRVFDPMNILNPGLLPQ